MLNRVAVVASKMEGSVFRLSGRRMEDYSSILPVWIPNPSLTPYLPILILLVKRNSFPPH